ncbi:hypothetical protein [Mangrovicoccus sp. HB161399]|uniref:hypothetical protein n=1 Tax=Mangrovicoccus sp. HB161399 TaxID=2720392 RepID=UPI001555231D|nr:hypothetical protein [Mangrovicoccus sp. HB161399]
MNYEYFRNSTKPVNSPIARQILPRCPANPEWGTCGAWDVEEPDWRNFWYSKNNLVAATVRISAPTRRISKLMIDKMAFYVVEINLGSPEPSQLDNIDAPVLAREAPTELPAIVAISRKLATILLAKWKAGTAYWAKASREAA